MRRVMVKLTFWGELKPGGDAIDVHDYIEANAHQQIEELKKVLSSVMFIDYMVLEIGALKEDDDDDGRVVMLLE